MIKENKNGTFLEVKFILCLEVFSNAKVALEILGYKGAIWSVKDDQKKNKTKQNKAKQKNQEKTKQKQKQKTNKQKQKKKTLKQYKNKNQTKQTNKKHASHMGPQC